MQTCLDSCITNSGSTCQLQLTTRQNRRPRQTQHDLMPRMGMWLPAQLSARPAVLMQQDQNLMQFAGMASALHPQMWQHEAYLSQAIQGSRPAGSLHAPATAASLPHVSHQQWQYADSLHPIRDKPQSSWQLVPAQHGKLRQQGLLKLMCGYQSCQVEQRGWYCMQVP